MSYLRIALVLFLLLSSAAYAQPDFDPVRLDAGNDNTFFYPALETTNTGSFLCTWTSGNSEWMGAYAREVDQWGNVLGPQDTVDIQSAVILTCPPRVTVRELNTGAWAKIIYHE